MDFIYKEEIELDDDKIISEDIYELDSIYDAVRTAYREAEIPEAKNNKHILTFISNRTDRDDFGRFAVVKTTLVKEDWFIRYVKRMTWYEKYDDGDVSVEDVLESYRRVCCSG